jgi:hypothetical protein
MYTYKHFCHYLDQYKLKDSNKAECNLVIFITSLKNSLSNLHWGTKNYVLFLLCNCPAKQKNVWIPDVIKTVLG